MVWAADSWRSWGLLLLGLLVFALLPWGMGELAREQARQLAEAHAQDQPGMLVWLYDNPFQTGPPQVSVRHAPDFHRLRGPRDDRPYPFSWRWLARLEAPQAGRYLLAVHASDAVRLLVDGREVIERWRSATPRGLTVLVDLEAGPHLLDLQNVQGRRGLDLELAWLPPGAKDIVTIDPDSLRPLDSGVSAVALEELRQAQLRWGALLWCLPLAWALGWVLFLRRPATTLAAWREHRWFLAILAAAAFLRLWEAAHIHGISGESAFFIWRAQLILEGARPFQGMNTRVGPLWDYLLALPVAIWGSGPWVLRGWAALTNLIALWFCYAAVGRTLGRPAALGACLMLAVLPASVIFSRVPVETTALGPLAFFAGLYLLTLAREHPPYSLLAGVIWGLAFFNHPIFAAVPMCLGAAALVVSRLRVLAWSPLWGLGAGFLLGASPRFWDRLVHRPSDVMTFTDPDRMAHLGGFMQMAGRVLDGEVVHYLFTGQASWTHPWLNVWALGLAAALIVAAALGRSQRQAGLWGLWLLLALGLHILLVPLGAPSANPRYYLFCVVLAALILGVGFGLAQGWTPARWRWLPVCALLALAGWNLADLAVNYFHTHAQTGGRTLTWHQEPLLDHTPDAWMDHSLLAQELIRRGYPVVATGDYWHHTLHLALNLYAQDPPVFHATDIQTDSSTERAAVFYNSHEGWDRAKLFLSNHQPRVFSQVKFGNDLDGKYLLFERVGPPVTYPDPWGERP